MIVKREGETALIKVGENAYYRYAVTDLAQIKGFRSRKSDRSLEQEYEKDLHDQISNTKMEKNRKCIQEMESALQELHDKYQIQQERDNH